MHYKETLLPSGLRVASETLPGFETVSLAVSVDVGARYENEAESGISHLLEHMAFKGTERRTARDIAEEFDDIGGHLNAYTSLEHTVYYAKVLHPDVSLAVDIIGDILQHSTFDAEELEKERQVILQEIAMHSDSPEDLVFDYFHDAIYPEQPIGRSILGTVNHISRFQSAEVQGFMQKHYHTPNMVISAAGNIEHEALLEMIEKQFSHLARENAPKAEPAVYVGGERREEMDFEQLHLMLGFPSVSYRDEDYHAAQLLSIILGGGMSSRLFQEVREKRGLVYNVNSFVTAYGDSGILGIYAATGEHQIQEMLPVLAEQVLEMTQNISENELRRAKNQARASLLMARESSSAIAEWIGRHLLCYGTYHRVQEIADKLERQTVEDIQRVAKKMLTGGALSMAAVGPIANLPDYATVSDRFRLA